MSQSKSNNYVPKSVNNKQQNSSLVHQTSSEIDYWSTPSETSEVNTLTTKEKFFCDLDKIDPETEENANNNNNIFLNPLVISSISIILLTNIISGAIIFFDYFTKIVDPNFLTQQLEKSQPPIIPNTPNLANKEFIELNLDTVSTLPNPIKSNHNQDFKAQKKSPTGTSKILKSVPDSDRNTSIATKKTISSSSLANSKYYYVFTEYTGDRSLEEAKKKGKNVSLVNFPQGLFIYLGAFYNQNEADIFVDRLRQEGIFAYIYHPE